MAAPAAAAGEIVIQRTTYALAGQTVAVRVSGDPVAANNGLFYLYSDHLSSASAIQHSQGGAPDFNRYLPFGDYRPGSGPNPLTDRAYTGQRENMDLGLYYYNARYYSPKLGRFITADTLVPDPEDPQSLNRYSYVLNNPLHFVDPTGHYGRNVHEYLTRQLASTVGVRVMEYGNIYTSLTVDAKESIVQIYATIIADANQGTDESWATTPINIFGNIHGVTPSEYYHFQSRGEAENRLRSAISVNNWNDFGIALHTFQDYFSHVGSGFSFPKGEVGIATLLDKCPECFSGDAYASNPYETAILEGHVFNRLDAAQGKDIFSATDHYNPTNPRDLTMALATEYWLTMWYLSYYQIDSDGYFTSIYGMTHEEYYNSLFE